MSRHFGNNKSLHICLVFLVVSFASFASGLSLEELSAEIRQLKQNNVELDSKVRRLQRDEVMRLLDC